MVVLEQVLGGFAQWKSKWHMLIVPPANLADERRVFNLAAPGEKTKCLPAGGASG